MSLVLKLLQPQGVPPTQQEEQSALLKHNPVRWWIFVAVNIVFAITGLTSAVLLERFYYEQGGSCIFMGSLVQAAGFPILLIPFLLLPRSSSEAPNPTPSKYTVLVYIGLGIGLAGQNLLCSLGLLYLSASTYSMICATQLVFNAIFSFFINKQILTPLIINSVGIVSFSAALVAINEDSSSPAGSNKSGYILGFSCALGAAAIYSLILSLMQLTFQKVLKKETFSVVLEVQIWVAMVSTSVSVVGLLASGQWKAVAVEMASFESGKTSYVMTLVGSASSWQVCSVGIFGLVFLVSSLFSNVISTVALAAAPICSVIVFRDEMNGVKIIAMLLAFWGFGSYIYQNYLDARALEFQAVKTEDDIDRTSHTESSC